MLLYYSQTVSAIATATCDLRAAALLLFEAITIATLPTCGPPLTLPPTLKLVPPPGGRGYVATLPTCGPPLILPSPLKRWDPPGGAGYVFTLPTFGPPLILPPALKRWGPPTRHGLCIHIAHLWATSASASRSEVLGTP